ncbi:peptide deformylase [Candidatus Vampirococcus lugosii]|uniref:Peptide deformylase n=1 Tax=Candidatus Vampirococcus lugosii TaxID=2789015 RepID=A0ABS5QL95_9BACT|nr:peptide deformylase [Candidatus Vampirococcus lugosii]MBS8121981.1 Peptide deformylase [Candidatus Vampirococcus lugosii]
MNNNFLIKKYPLQKGKNNTILRNKSDEVETFDKELTKFCSELKKLMFIYDGVGLSAPQIGLNTRVVAISRWNIRGDKRTFIEDLILINPIITKFSSSKNDDIEGCLSLPGIEGIVTRSDKINVSFYNPKGKLIKKQFAGIDARIVQHEVDHLNGILFTDKIKNGNKSGLVLDKFVNLT